MKYIEQITFELERSELAVPFVGKVQKIHTSLDIPMVKMVQAIHAINKVAISHETFSITATILLMPYTFYSTNSTHKGMDLEVNSIKTYDGTELLKGQVIKI